MYSRHAVIGSFIVQPPPLPPLLEYCLIVPGTPHACAHARPLHTGATGVYVSFLIWGWNLRYQALEDFNRVYDSTEYQEACSHLEEVYRTVCQQLPSSADRMSSELYRQRCLAVAALASKKKGMSPQVKKSRQFLTRRYINGRLLVETLKLFHVANSPVQYLEQRLWYVPTLWFVQHCRTPMPNCSCHSYRRPHQLSRGRSVARRPLVLGAWPCRRPRPSTDAFLLLKACARQRFMSSLTSGCSIR